MMKDQNWSLDEFELRPPALPSLISECEKALGVEFPRDYREFMMTSNGGEGFIGLNSYLMLWSIEELVPLNTGYEISNYLPGSVLFGSSGGGEAFGFDMRATHTKIVQVPFIGMDWKAAKFLSESFEDFLIKLSES